MPPVPYDTNAAPSSGVSQAAYAYQPAQVQSTAPQNATVIDPNTGKPVLTMPTVGAYGTNVSGGQLNQRQNERFSIANDANYGDYQRLGTQAQGYGQQAQTTLNNAGVQSAIQAQTAQASGPSVQQYNAQRDQNLAMQPLAAAANGGGTLAGLAAAANGQGPSAANIQSQQSISQAMHAQLAAGASARGGAYAQAAAQSQAAQQAAGLQAQGVGQAAAQAAQDQQAAMGQYAQAVGQAQGQYAQAAGQSGTLANQAYGLQTSALQGSEQAQAGQQNLAMNYYTGQQNALQQQSQFAGQLAQNQVANDYGLAGTAMQTSTQQNIANQNQAAQYVGAGTAAVGGLLMALASTGGAESAARGARDAGASAPEAQRIGTDIGQALGLARVGDQGARMARPADAEAARRGALSEADVHAHLAALRGMPLPGPATEPLAPQAYAAGSHMAALARQVRGSVMADLQDIVSQYPDDIGGAYNPAPAGLQSVAPPPAPAMTPSPPPMSPAPPPVPPTSLPPQTPDEIRNASQAILSSPALSEEQKQTALAALPRVAPGGPTAAPAPSPGVAQMQPEGRRPAVPVPYPGTGAAPGGPGLSPNDYLALAAKGGPRPGWNPSTRTVEGVGYSPDTLSSIGRTLSADQAERGAQFGVENAQIGAEGRAARVLGAHDEMQAAEDKIHRDAQMAKIGAYHDHIQSLQASAEEASKINPDQFWSSKSTGKKIMLGLGMALRGFSFGLTGRGDPLEWLNQQIHENIEAQKAKAAGARNAVGDAMNLYQLNKDALGDEDRAYQATALAQRTALQGQLQRYVNDATAEPMSKLRAAQLLQANAQEISATQRDLDEKTAKQVTNERYTPVGTGRDILSRIDRAGKIKSGLENLSGTDIGTREKEATIAHTEAQTRAEDKKAAAGPAKGQVDAYDNALDGLYEMRKMVAKGGTISSAETARGEALRNRLVNELARAQTGGTRAPSKEEQELIAAQIAKDPNAFQFTGADNARLDETIKAVERARARAAGTRMPGELPPGVTPGAVPTGEAVPGG